MGYTHIKSDLVITAIKNIAHANLDAIFPMINMPFKGGVIVENIKKLAFPEVLGIYLF